MQTMLDKPSAGRTLVATAVIGLLVFGGAIGVLMTPYTEVLGMDRLGMLTCLQMAATPVRAVEFLSYYSQTELVAISGLLIPGDVTFAWGYGLVFTGLLGLLTLRLTGAWYRAGALLMWAPLLASAFDVLEDLGLYSIVGQAALSMPPELNPTVVFLTTVCAALKYLLLAGVGPVYAVLGSAVAFREQRSAGSVIVYILVILVALSMVQKPLQEIPACF